MPSVLADARLTASDIKCMGVTAQRNTFITWDRWVFGSCF